MSKENRKDNDQINPDEIIMIPPKVENSDTHNTRVAFCSEELLSQAGGSLFSLARIAMLRALELAAGKRPRIENPSSDKVATIAFEEIAQGKILFQNKK